MCSSSLKLHDSIIDATLQTNGCKQIARPSTKMGWNACIPNLEESLPNNFYIENQTSI